MTNALLKPPPTLTELRARRAEILAIAERYNALDVRVFGSVARGQSLPGSDLDLLVRFAPGATLYDISGLRLDLIDLLGVNVDIISDHPHLTPGFRQRAERDAVPL